MLVDGENFYTCHFRFYPIGNGARFDRKLDQPIKDALSKRVNKGKLLAICRSLSLSDPARVHGNLTRYQIGLPVNDPIIRKIQEIKGDIC